MGVNSSKSEANKHQHLSTDEYQQLKTQFMTVSKGRPEVCNKNDLTKFWERKIDPHLLKLILNYFFASRSTINFESYARLFVNIVRGSIEEKIETLFKLFMGDSNIEEIPVKSAIDYVQSIVSSYMISLQSSNDKGLLSWKSNKCSLSETALKQFTDFLCQDLPQTSPNVSIREMELWVMTWSKITILESLVYLSLYQLTGQELEGEVQKASLVPICVGLHKGQSFPSILDLSNVTCINSCLPAELQDQWRFLFSTAIHGESFSKLLGAITNQGPTLLIIEDKEGHVFGGYAPTSWHLGPNFIGNDSSFLFSLKPLIRVYSTTGYNMHYQYLNIQQQTLPNGLGMGGQFDYFGLWLEAEFGRGHCSETCTTFRDYHMLSASKDFEVNHVEVWGVGAPPKLNEEEGDRSVLDGNLEARAMLEMVGKTRHSEGLREPPEENYS